MKKLKIQTDYDVVDVDEEKELSLSDEINQRENKMMRNRFFKWFFHLLFGIFMVALVLTIFSIVSFYWTDSTLQSAVIEKMKTDDEIHYYTEDVDISYIEKIQKYEKTLPQEIQDRIKDKWKIVIADEVPQKLLYSLSLNPNEYDTSKMLLGGYTFPQPRIIYVNSSLEIDMFVTSYIHEIGHMLSFEHGSLHGSSEWEKIYDENRFTYDMDDYGLSTEAEFFASCYEAFEQRPDSVKKQSQEIYDYFEAFQNKPLETNTFVGIIKTGITNGINTVRVYFYTYIAPRSNTIDNTQNYIE